MFRKGVTILALVVTAIGVGASARAGNPHDDDPPAEAKVPNTGYAIIGDGNPVNPSSSYRNLASGSSEDNLVAVYDSPPYLYLIPDKSSRHIKLRVSSRADGTPMDPIEYKCEAGALYVSSSNAALQCYNAAKNDGFYVDFPPFSKSSDPERLYSPCFALEYWYDGDGTFHMNADGSRCVAHLSDREKGRSTLLTDVNGDPILFHVPASFHAHTLPQS
jgi:hypothetical protein